MKKIFTLLFCIGAMALVSNANTLHERCIEYLLNNNAAPTLNATQQNDLDANHDGVINMELAEAQMTKAPSHKATAAEIKGSCKKMMKIMPISRTIKKPAKIDQKIKKEEQR